MLKQTNKQTNKKPVRLRKTMIVLKYKTLIFFEKSTASVSQLVADKTEKALNINFH